MRYFFHVVHSDNDSASAINDDDGTVFSDPQTAMSQAAVIAVELAQDGRSYEGYVVWVIDEKGEEVGTVPIVVGA